MSNVRYVKIAVSETGPDPDAFIQELLRQPMWAEQHVSAYVLGDDEQPDRLQARSDNQFKVLQDLKREKGDLERELKAVRAELEAVQEELGIEIRDHSDTKDLLYSSNEHRDTVVAERNDLFAALEKAQDEKAAISQAMESLGKQLEIAVEARDRAVELSKKIEKAAAGERDRAGKEAERLGRVIDTQSDRINGLVRAVRTLSEMAQL